MTPLQTRLIKWGTISLALIVLVWTLGPYLAIANNIPFGSLTSRLSATLIIIIAWSVLATKGLLDNRDLSTLSLTATQREMTSGFRQQVKDVLTTAHKMLPFMWLARRRRPWILMLGESQVGKTTLLAQSGIALISPQKKSLNTVRPTQSIDWWISDEVMFADPSGSYCLALDEDAEKQTLWRTFLKTIRRYRWNHSFDAAIIALDLQTIASNNREKLTQLANKIQQQLVAMTQHRRPIRLTIVITQCDQLYGFSDFFNDLGPEEREQHFGLTLQNNQQNIPFSDFLRQRAQDFIKRMSERLIWRMHQEHNLDVRARIKDFPAQMESLIDTLNEFIDTFPSSINQAIQGIYFCSSVQNDQAVNLLTQSIEENFSLTEVKTPALLMRKKPYFISALLQDIIKDAKSRTHIIEKNERKQTLTYSIAIATVVFGVLIWHFGYRQNIAALHRITKELGTVSQGNIPWLSKLNTLNDIIHDPKQRAASYYRWIGLSQTAELKQQAQNTYNSLLESSFTNYLNQLLVSAIRKNETEDPIALYKSLQVYLMFSDPSHLSTDVIKEWFKSLWLTQFPHNKKMRTYLSQHLNHLLNLHHFSWLNSPSLVESAQNKLKSSPQETLAFLILQGKEQNQGYTPLFKGTAHAPNLDTSQATIPALYAENHFKTIYEKEIPQVVDSLRQGDWVLGQLDIPSLTISERNNLIEEVKLLYLKNAIRAWQKATYQAKLMPPKNLQDVLNIIESMRNPSSPFWGLISRAINNVTINNKSFADLNAFLQQDETYEATQIALKNTYDYLSNITHAKTQEPLYQATAERMKKAGQGDAITNLEKVARQTPEPIKQWLTTIAQSSWRLMLSGAQDYLNTVWSSSVLPAYNGNIKNRYPVFVAARNEISLSDFNHFFGPGGTIETFFNDYLLPFVNTNEFYWTWKKLDDASLDIPQPTLEMLIRASMIQRMFYQDSQDKPSVAFTLTPLHLSANASRFRLNLGGQLIASYPSSKTSHALKWPGSDGNFVRLTFNSLDHKQLNQALTGEWSWFRLLANADLQPEQDPRQYTLVFHIGEYEATYRMIASSRVNPYIKNVLSAFRCPSRL